MVFGAELLTISSIFNHLGLNPQSMGPCNNQLVLTCPLQQPVIFQPTTMLKKPSRNNNQQLKNPKKQPKPKTKTKHKEKIGCAHKKSNNNQREEKVCKVKKVLDAVISSEVYRLVSVFYGVVCFEYSGVYLSGFQNLQLYLAR
jgi:hypothetical protein